MLGTTILLVAHYGDLSLEQTFEGCSRTGVFRPGHRVCRNIVAPFRVVTHPLHQLTLGRTHIRDRSAAADRIQDPGQEFRDYIHRRGNNNQVSILNSCLQRFSRNASAA